MTCTDTNQTIAQLTTIRRVETRTLSFLSFILVPFLRLHDSYSCRCQAKRMYLVVAVKAAATFLVFISSEGHWTLVPADLQSLLKLWDGFTGCSLKSGAFKDEHLGFVSFFTCWETFLLNHFTFRKISLLYIKYTVSKNHIVSKGKWKAVIYTNLTIHAAQKTVISMIELFVPSSVASHGDVHLMVFSSTTLHHMLLYWLLRIFHPVFLQQVQGI